MTETEKTWSDRVAEWRSSGQTAPEFAQGRGFEPSTLRYWASRLRKLEAGPGDAPAVRMARVRVTRRAAQDALVVVAVGSARIEVRPGFDRMLLRDVIAALGGAR